MTDYIDLCIKYSGFTILGGLPRTSVDWADRGAEADVTSPSVINTYFAETLSKEKSGSRDRVLLKNQSSGLMGYRPNFVEKRNMSELNFLASLWILLRRSRHGAEKPEPVTDFAKNH